MFRKETYTPKFKRRFLLGLEIVLYLVGIGLLIQVFFVGDTLTNTFDTEAAARLIISKQQMQQNTTMYQNWIANTCDDVCAIQIFSYYVFNITNPEQVRDNGEYPQLQELGPFVFNRYEIRKNVKFSTDGSIVSYKYEYKYVLNEELSDISLWNVTTWNKYELENRSYPAIYVLNPFMLAAFAQCRMSNDGAGGGAICNAVGFANKEQFYFSNFSIQSILQIGMESQTDIACNRNALCNKTQKYIADEDVYVSEYTGNGNGGDMQRMRELITFYQENQTFAGSISSVNDEFYEWWAEREYFETLREPKQWAFDTIESDSILKAWMMDKYRSVNLIENGTLDVEGISVVKFIIDPNEYLSAQNNTKNNKYYQNGGIYDGLLNLTTTNGADVLQYSSKPYFLDAPYYVETINNKMGLRQPNRLIDDTYFAIDTKLGTVFQVQAGYQVSFAIYPCDDCGWINPFRHIPRVIVPQFYVKLTGGAPPAALEQYKSILALLDTSFQYSIYVGPAIALCCFVIAFYLTGRRYCKWKRKHALTFYMDDDDKAYIDHEWRDNNGDQNDNEIEYNAEDHPHHQYRDSSDDLDDSIFHVYARRDDDNAAITESIDKTMTDNHERWKNTQSDDNKKQTSKLLSKITSKMDTYSS